MRVHTINVYNRRSPVATNDAGNGSSHRCKVMIRGSTTLMIPTKTYAEIRATGLMVDGEWVRKSRYGDKITLDVSCFFSSLLLFIGSRPGTNGVGTDFYHLPLEVEFSRVLDRPKGHPEWY
jgi:hypothetical protein